MTKQHKTEVEINAYINKLSEERKSITTEIEICYENLIAMQGFEITDEIYRKYWNITHSRNQILADDIDSVALEDVLETIYFRDIDAWVEELHESSDKLPIKFDVFDFQIT